MSDLNKHVKSDKIKWIATAIALLLLSSALIGVSVLLFGKNKQKPSETITADFKYAKGAEYTASVKDNAVTVEGRDFLGQLNRGVKVILTFDSDSDCHVKVYADLGVPASDNSPKSTMAITVNNIAVETINDEPFVSEGWDTPVTMYLCDATIKQGTNKIIFESLNNGVYNIFGFKIVGI